MAGSTSALTGFTVRYSGLTEPIRYHTFFETMGQVPTAECADHAQKYAAMRESLRKHLSKESDQIAVDGTKPTRDEVGNRCGRG